MQQSRLRKLSGVVLGIGAPNRTKDGNVVQCAVVLDQTLGMTRIFASYRNSMERLSIWDVCTLDVTHTSKDPRFESWKLVNASVDGKIGKSHEKRSLLDRCVLNTDGSTVIKTLNAEKRSIALLRPNQTGIGYGMEIRDFDISDDWIVTQSETPQRPYLQWESSDGCKHKTQIVSHEVYEWLRKNPSQHAGLWDNLQITNIDFDKWLLIGNAKDHRNTWFVIHVHRLKKTTDSHIGSSCTIADGKPRDWPYLHREVARANHAAIAGQRLLFTICFTILTWSLGNIAMTLT